MKRLSHLLTIVLVLTPQLVFAYSLPVPHTMQAPRAQWGLQPWEDACEEATTIMVDAFYSNLHTASRRIPRADAESAIKKIVELENKHFGFNKDTNAEQIVYIINNFFPWEAYIVDNPSLDQIKDQIDLGFPVIALTHGRSLGNPYFRIPGPDYHVFVISGYDDGSETFITQEPGTRHGLDLRYSYDTIMRALHDFTKLGQTQFGKKRVIFTKPSLSLLSAHLDGDDDGLTKQDELIFGTSLMLSDTDQDGYTDGMEASAGYSPIVDEGGLGRGSLMKTKNDHKVYVLSDDGLEWIRSEEEFLKKGWKWAQIVTVSKAFFSKFFQ